MHTIITTKIFMAPFKLTQKQKNNVKKGLYRAAKRIFPEINIQDFKKLNTTPGKAPDDPDKKINHRNVLYYVGTITKVRPNRYEVTYKDGDQEILNEDEVVNALSVDMRLNVPKGSFNGLLVCC